MTSLEESSYRYIVSPDWLAKNLNNPRLWVADCRFVLGQPDAGREAYHQAHIPGAHYLDLELDLSSPVREHGGRHPLPNIEELAQKLTNKGLSNDHIVILYDDQNSAMAARAWWLFKYMGHQQVQILNSGFSGWMGSGYPVTNVEPEIRKAGDFTPRVDASYVIDVHQLRGELEKDDITLIDSRSADRYAGENETIDVKAGHIPGALNLPFLSHLQGGSWNSPEEIKKRFSEQIPDNQGKEIVFYCGSGVTACVNVLALAELGQQAKLYVGSWSDWISYPEHPIQKGSDQGEYKG